MRRLVFLSLLVVSAPKGSQAADLANFLYCENLVVKYCYERALNEVPDYAGVVTVSVSLNSLGDVTTATIAGSSFSDPHISDCALRKAKRLRFPEPTAPRITYEIQLAPGKQDGTRSRCFLPKGQDRGLVEPPIGPMSTMNVLVR